MTTKITKLAVFASVGDFSFLIAIGLLSCVVAYEDESVCV